MGFIVREMVPGDWGQVSDIYAEGIATGNSTFETEVPGYDLWASWHIPGCSIVACDGDTVLAWGALSPYSGRQVYSGVAEASIYVGKKYRGNGIGTALLRALIARSESQGFWTLQAAIFPENGASMAMCEKLGFREVGVRRQLGRMNGAWRDVVLLERRSDRVGVD